MPMSSLPSTHVAAFAGRNEVSGDERLLRVAICGYLSRLCEKAMVRVAYDDALERLAIKARKRKGLHQLHLLTKEIGDAKIQRRAMALHTKFLRVDLHRLDRMALHPNRFAVRRVSGGSLHPC